MINKLKKLEYIRGFAALYVVFHHSFFADNFLVFGYNISFMFKFGQEAVILFFLMSGFVIGYSFELSRDKSFLSYLEKRFFRIYIPLIIVITTHILLLYVVNRHVDHFSWKQLVENLFMFQDIASLKPNVICEPFLGNLPLWSLSYEWWFYIAFFPLYRLSKHANINLIVATLSIAAAIAYMVYPFFINRILLYLSVWWIGVAMAKAYLQHGFVSFNSIKTSYISLVVCLGILSLNAIINKPTIVSSGTYPLLEIRHFAFALSAVSISLVWQRLHWRYFDYLFQVFGRFAPYSYVIYISHYFFIIDSSHVALFNNRYLAFFTSLCITLSYSYIVEVKIYPLIRHRLSLRKYFSNIILLYKV